MHPYRNSAILLVLLAGCQSDTSLHGDKDHDQSFDEGEDVTPPVDNGDDTGVPPDSGGSTTPPQYCDPRDFSEEDVDQNVSCDGGPATPDWDLEVLWETQVGSGTYSPPVVGQLDDDDGDGDVDADDIPDIIVLDRSAVMYSISGADGSVNWQRSISNTYNSLAAIGDVNGDGFPDVVTDINYTVVAIDGRTGSTIWTGPSSTSKNKGSCGAFGMADLDGDGTPEVYLGSKIINGRNGQVRGTGSYGKGLGVGNSYGHSVAVDLDGDGDREVVVGNAAYDADGSALWANGGSDGTVAVADLDLDGSPEIVSVGNYGVYGMDNDGDELWHYDLGGASASTPVIADLDGDGYPEVIIPTANAVYALDGEGDKLWSYSASSSSGRGGASAYDLDGDGTWEVIWAGPTATVVLDGENGDVLTQYSGSNTTCAGPVPIVDLDGDDQADIVQLTSDGRLRALRDAAGFTDARPVWHQSDYSLTNVEDDGGMPTDPTPNWQGENNFRAGESAGIVQNVYPVIRDVCADECSAGSAWVWYSVANNGWHDMTGTVKVEIWGDVGAGTTWLADDSWSGTLAAGKMSASNFVELKGVTSTLTNLQVRLTGSTSPDFTDCQTSDDIATWTSDVCL